VGDDYNIYTPPQKVELGYDGMLNARCANQACGKLTGPVAWWWYKLRGLYCSAQCCYTSAGTVTNLVRR